MLARHPGRGIWGQTVVYASTGVSSRLNRLVETMRKEKNVRNEKRREELKVARQKGSPSVRQRQVKKHEMKLPHLYVYLLG